MASLTRGRNRTMVLAFALIALATWALLAVIGRGEGPSPAGAAATGRTERAASSRKGKSPLTAEDVPVVVAGLARGGRSTEFERERSLFDFARSPEELKAEEDARRLAAEEARRRAEEQAKAAAEAARAAAERSKLEAAEREKRLAAERTDRAANPPKPDPPSFPYQYIGTIGPTSDPYAILTGADREYRYVRTGEVIDDKFKLEAIKEFRLDLSFTDSRFADQFAQVARSHDSAKAR